MLSEYLPILLLVPMVVALAAGMILFSIITSQKAKTNPAKNQPWECGLPALTKSAPRVRIQFYLVAMLFILFDVEVVFLYPWAAVYREMLRDGMAVFWSMMSFLGILFAGFAYAWKKGVFSWR